MRVIIIVLLTLVFISGCSITKIAMTKVADALSGSESSAVFTGDNDPDLVGDALPFTIKMYESLLASLPDHDGLQLQTGSMYIMYANAFLYNPATMLEEEKYLEQEHLFNRAKNLYLRGRDILLRALEKKHPGFLEALLKKNYKQALSSMTIKDINFLYWAGAGWLGAFAIDPFDMEIGLSVPKAAALMDKVKEMNESFRNGAIHDFYVLYYGSLPDYMGGSATKARLHFKKAVEISQKKDLSPYLSLATTISVKEQNIEEFRNLLEMVLSSDIKKYPGNLLINTLNQRKAKWLLKHIEDFFLLENPETGEGIESTTKLKSLQEGRDEI